MIVITGGSGRLGRELRQIYPEALAPDRHALDLSRRDSVWAFIRAHRPQVVVHAAGFTSVQAAEHERERCWEVNVRGTEWLVEALEAGSADCHLVYVSTACVFHGDRGGYTEADVPYPKNFYGLTKLLGESAARRLRSHLVVRTNIVARGARPYPAAFVDRFGTYLYADEVARALGDLVSRRLTGVVHVAGDRRLSMFDLAALATPSVRPISMREVSLPLTVDMSLASVRIPAFRLTPAALNTVSTQTERR
jgi:dTDP-4-dehydrorhamnose reductase